MVEIGAIDEKTYQVGTDALVIDTGPWIFGTKVLIPAGLISRIDEMDHRSLPDLHEGPGQELAGVRRVAPPRPVVSRRAGHVLHEPPVGPGFGASDPTLR